MEQSPDSVLFDKADVFDRQRCDEMLRAIRTARAKGDYRLSVRGDNGESDSREVRIARARHAAGLAVDISMQSPRLLAQPLESRLEQCDGTPGIVVIPHGELEIVRYMVEHMDNPDAAR